MEDEVLIKAYLQQYEEKLQQALVALCRQEQLLPKEGPMPYTDDLLEKWNEIAPEYLADAVPQIAEYPEVSVAWALYLGMAWANVWHQDWQEGKKRTYSSFYGPRAFDDMDEHIVRDILGLPLESPEAEKIEEMMRSCAHTAMTFIRREDTEAQTTKAFYLFARTTRVLFRIGAALSLKRLGYKFEKQIVC